MDAGGLLAVWLAYSLFAYPLLCVASLFKVRNPWAVFLAGAFYGWFEEGIMVQTMYGSDAGPFPASISFTGLAWHALIGVWIGWYLMRRVLAQNNYFKTLLLASAIGLFYGCWSIFWWNEPPPPMKVLIDAGQKDVLFSHFAMFAFGATWSGHTEIFALHPPAGCRDLFVFTHQSTDFAATAGTAAALKTAAVGRWSHIGQHGSQRSYNQRTDEKSTSR